MPELLLKDEVYAIVGAAVEVHKALGPGFLEAVYHEALEIESDLRQLPYVSRQRLRLYYKERLLEKEYEADLVYFGKVIVELKALDCLTSREVAQVLNYLKATGLRVGLLFNFGSNDRLEWKRLVRGVAGPFVAP